MRTLTFFEPIFKFVILIGSILSIINDSISLLPLIGLSTAGYLILLYKQR